ncbi:hypothetical protein PFISCL1PPCAC_8239, partial [Pristionchus fissidentatus]
IVNIVLRFYDLNNVNAYVYDSSSDIFRMVTKSSPRIPIYVGVEAIVGILVIVSCAILNENSFFFISLFIFLSQSVNILILLLYYYFYVISFNRPFLWAVFAAMLYTSDVFSLGPGLYTLLVPGPIRRRCISIV